MYWATQLRSVHGVLVQLDSLGALCYKFCCGAVGTANETHDVSLSEGKGSITAPGYTFRQALSNSPSPAALFVLCIAAVAPLLTLFTYHIRLVLLNRSTVEQIRINTARDYGEHKELELGTHGENDDAASTFGAAETNRRGRRGGQGRVRALFERF